MSPDESSGRTVVGLAICIGGAVHARGEYFDGDLVEDLRGYVVVLPR